MLFCLCTAPVMAQDAAEECGKPDNKKAEKYFSQAVIEFNAKDYKAFETDIGKAIGIAPDYADAYLLQARASRQKGNMKTMILSYEKLIEICPDYMAEPYLQLGSFYFLAKDYERAIPTLEKLLSFPKLKDEDIQSAESKLNIARFRKDALEHPVPFDPQSVPGICTDEDEYLPIISPDNELAFFTRRFRKASKNTLTDQLVEEFTYSRLVNGQYTKGEKMKPPFNMNNNEGGATVTIDNKDLFFTICRPDIKGINCDIYHSQLSRNGIWGDISTMGGAINDPVQWDSQPSISSDGNTLYFASGRDGGYGGYDIYKCERDSNGHWGSPSNLGPVINTAGNEKSPSIHTDSKTLYYSSDSLTGMGGYDIFYAKVDGNGEWQPPRNIGYPINSESDDIGFFVSTDGKTGYFSSNTLQGKGGWDIYSFYLYPEARPGKVLFIKGQLKDEGTGKPVNGKIEFKDAKTSKVYKVNVDSTTGDYVSALNFENDYIMTVKKKGYVPASKYIPKSDSVFSEPLKLDLTVKSIEVGKTYTLNDIHFATNSYSLTDTSKILLEGLVDFLNDNPTLRISINGHTDNVNDEQSNQQLSESRAREVFNYLADRGIAQGRLAYKGYGESVPVASNDTPAGRAQNRRTEFSILAR